jgi:hypothetical protein
MRSCSTASIFPGRTNSTGDSATLDYIGRRWRYPQSNFNNVSFADQESRNATTGVLNDSFGLSTGITLSFTSNDSWNTGAVGGDTIDPNALANNRLLDGIIKGQDRTVDGNFVRLDDVHVQ